MIGFVIWSLFGSVYNLWNHFCYIRIPLLDDQKYTIRSVVGYWCDGGNNCNYGCL